MIPGQSREGARQLQSTRRDVDKVRLKRGRHHLAHQVRTGRRKLRGLQHHAIAGRQHVHQRPQPDLKWKVPRNNVADHTLRLALHKGTQHPGVGLIHFARLRAHPLLQVLQCELRALGDRKDLQRIGTSGRVHTEVRIQRRNDAVPVAEHHRDDAFQTFAPDCQARLPVFGEGTALGLEGCLQVLDRFRIPSARRRGLCRLFRFQQ